MAKQVSVAIVAFDGCIGSTVHGLLDAFACANACATEHGKGQAPFDVRLVSRDGGQARSYSGQIIGVHGDLSDAEGCNLILLAPFMLSTVPSSAINAKLEPLLALVLWLREQSKAGSCIGTSCTGSFLLAEAGLLDGKVATTHWRAAQAFRGRYPQVVLRESELVTEDGNLVCGGGAVSYIDLAIHLIRRFAGAELALQCARMLVVDPGRDRQSPYLTFSPEKAHGDRNVLKVQEWLEGNYWTDVDAESLAKLLGMSSRNLKRRFKAACGETITGYLQRVRIAAACDRLIVGDAPIQQIIFDIGYADAASFGRLFRASTGVTMGEYRRRFSSPPARATARAANQ